MESLIARLDEELPAPIRDRRPLGGGSINDAWRLELEDGQYLFLKTHDQLQNFRAIRGSDADVILNVTYYFSSR